METQSSLFCQDVCLGVASAVVVLKSATKCRSAEAEVKQSPGASVIYLMLLIFQYVDIGMIGFGCLWSQVRRKSLKIVEQASKINNTLQNPFHLHESATISTPLNNKRWIHCWNERHTHFTGFYTIIVNKMCRLWSTVLFFVCRYPPLLCYLI